MPVPSAAPPDPLHAALASYVAAGADEGGQAARLLDLVAAGAEVLDRSVPLHVTGSALPVHPDTGRVALHWHRKVGRWLQLGGHAEPGERDPARIAHREAEEESGLDLRFFPEPARPVLVHVDVVPVPAAGGEPAHHHGDLRYVVATADPSARRAGPAREALRWCTPAEALDLAVEDGLRTLVRRAAEALATWRGDGWQAGRRGVEGEGRVIRLTDEMRERIATALADGHPVVAASVDEGGVPKLSFYGSTQVFSDDQLAIWVRDPGAGLPQRLAGNPHMAFLYRNPAERVAWQFQGRARVVDDPEVRRRVYEVAPEAERARDPEMRGLAVVVDVDRVVGRDVRMERDTNG